MTVLFVVCDPCTGDQKAVIDISEIEIFPGVGEEILLHENNT